MTAGYLRTVTYGFRRDDSWIEPTLRYTAFELADPGFGDDPGRVRARADISGASFYSYLTYSKAWAALSGAEQVAFKKSLPFERRGAAEPGIDGYLQRDLSYSAGGAWPAACHGQELGMTETLQTEDLFDPALIYPDLGCAGTLGKARWTGRPQGPPVQDPHTIGSTGRVAGLGRPVPRRRVESARHDPGETPTRSP